MYAPYASMSVRAWPRTHAHTPTASHTLTVSDLHRHDRPPPCRIYPRQCGGEGRLLLVSNKRATSEWEEAIQLPGFASFKDPQPSPPCRPLVSLQMKWTNAKSMFLVSLITVFIPPSLIVSWQIERILMAMIVSYQGFPLSC